LTDDRRPHGVPRPIGARRDGPAGARGRARRRHTARGVREGGAATVRLPARVPRGRRALGALHLPRDRAARGVALARPDARALDPRHGRARRLRGRHELAPLVLRDSLPAVATASRYPREVFERDVARILDYIRAGDTFQTVLSRRQEAAGAVDPLLLYRYLRALNPAPYLFYL